MSPKQARSSDPIREAIRQIPTLILEEHSRTHPPHSSDTSPQAESRSPMHFYESPKHGRVWLFWGVIISSSIILLFWILFISNLFYENKKTLNPTTPFVTSQKNDFSMVLGTFSAMEEELKKSIKKPSEIKVMIAQALLPLFTTSSTQDIATSTTTTTDTGIDTSTSTINTTVE